MVLMAGGVISLKTIKGSAENDKRADRSTVLQGLT